MRYHYKECPDWQEIAVTISGAEHTGYYSNLRVDPESLPENYYLYEVRDEDSNGEPCEIAHRIAVNFFGTLILDTPIDEVEKKGYAFTSPEDFNFGDSVDKLALDKS